MDESRHFRITLNLSHFFHDHRSMCRIFINKKMKHVSDLQDHIFNIFNLNDFYMISQNHYIPPTEDIRILQQDDIVFAIPNVLRNIPIYTSTPKIKTATYPSIETKRKRCIVDEEKEDASSNIVYLNKKKKKKTKVDVKEECQLEQSWSYKTVQKESQDNVMIDTDLINCQTEKKESQENVMKDTDLINCQTEKKKKKKKKKKEISFPNVSNTNLEEYSEHNLDNSVKEKVLYFEKQLILDAPKQTYPCTTTIPVFDHQLTNQEQKDHEISNNVPSKLTLDREENQENSCNEFRHKKLFVQKRNANIIDFNLPKNSNVVKSVLVSSKSLKSVNGDTDKFQDIVKSSIFNVQDVKNSINHKNDEFKDVVNGELITNTDDGYLKLCKLKNDLLHVYKLHEEVHSTDNPQCDAEEINMNKCTLNPKHTSQDIENGIEIAQSFKCFNKINDTQNVETIDVSAISNVNKNDCATTSNIENTTVQMRHMLNSVSRMDSQKYEDGSDICSEINVSKVDSCTNINISAEEEPSPFEVNSCSSLSTCLENTDNQSFVTKRKRKRTRRKPKLKSVDNSVPVVAPIEFDWRPSSIAPVVHIKFNDDGEPLEISDESVKQNSQELVQPHINNGNKFAGISIIELEHTRDDTTLLDKESVEPNFNNITEEKRLSCSNNDLISEDTILKSPLMTSTKPKVGDLIAFKILRLTEDYTPEISKHIIGEILSVLDSTLDVNIKIIDGIDQCAEPEGKFAIEVENNEYNNVKSYSWSSLLSPRLLYP